MICHCWRAPCLFLFSESIFPQASVDGHIVTHFFGHIYIYIYTEATFIRNMISMHVRTRPVPDQLQNGKNMIYTLKSTQESPASLCLQLHILFTELYFARPEMPAGSIYHSLQNHRGLISEPWNIAYIRRCFFYD